VPQAGPSRQKQTGEVSFRSASLRLCARAKPFLSDRTKKEYSRRDAKAQRSQQDALGKRQQEMLLPSAAAAVMAVKKEWIIRYRIILRPNPRVVDDDGPPPYLLCIAVWGILRKKSDEKTVESGANSVGRGLPRRSLGEAGSVGRCAYGVEGGNKETDGLVLAQRRKGAERKDVSSWRPLRNNSSSSYELTQTVG